MSRISNARRSPRYSTRPSSGSCAGNFVNPCGHRRRGHTVAVPERAELDDPHAIRDPFCTLQAELQPEAVLPVPPTCVNDTSGCDRQACRASTARSVGRRARSPVLAGWWRNVEPTRNGGNVADPTWNPRSRTATSRRECAPKPPPICVPGRDVRERANVRNSRANINVGGSRVRDRSRLRRGPCRRSW